MQNLPVDIENSIRVTACPHPFKLASQEYSFAPTVSLSQILKEVQPDALLRRRAHIWVDDKYVPPEKWDSTFPLAGADIALRAVPSGGFGRIIGTIFLAIAAIVVGALLTGGIGFLGIGGLGLPMWAGALGALAVGVVGTMALNALFPPVRPGGAGTIGTLSAMPGQMDYGQSSPTLSITGAQNKANLWGPVPFILGRFRVAPFYGARTYTESVGGDQYLRLLFIWGFSPVQLEDIRILDTALEYYQGVEVEHRNLTLLTPLGTIAINVTTKTLTRTYGSWLLEGIKAGNTVTLSGCTTPANDTDYLITDVTHQVLTYSTSTATTTEAGNGAQRASITFGDDPLTLYTVDIQETALSIELEQNVENVHTSEQDADELSVDIACNSLMGLTPAGGTYEMTVAFEVYCRPTGTSDPWSLINRTLVVAGVPATPGTPAIPTYINPLAPFDWFGIRIPGTPIPGTAGTSGSPDVYGSIVLTGNTKSQVRGNVSWKIPRGQYDVKVKRITAPDTIWTSSVSFWVALRTIKNEDPIDFPFPLAQTAMRIKATGQLNGTVDELKGTLTTICPDWDADTSTWIIRPTQNPASLYRKVLQGVQNQKPLADSRIDLANLEYWHAYCVTQGWKYHKYIDYTATIEDLLREIAAAARSAFSRIDSKVGVIIDEPQAFTIGPAFTPRNILKDSFQANITIVDRPHAFRCPFINEDMQYQQDERLVLSDGYQIDDLDAWGVSHPEYPLATIFEQLDLPGVTDPELIFRHARYHGAVAKLRCETTQFGTDIEWMVATRGDRIKFAHDVMLAGLSWGRVKSLILEDGSGYIAGVVADEIMPMDPDLSYVMRFRLGDNTSLLISLNSIDDRTVTYGSGRTYGSGVTYGKATGVITYGSGLTFGCGFTYGKREVVDKTMFATPINPADLHPEIGDLYLFGEADLEAIDLIIKSIQPNSDLSATVIALPYDENIYLADVGTVPNHDPKISVPVEWWSPIISWIRSDGTVLFPIPGGGWQSRILVSLLRPSALDSQITGVEARFWVTDSVGVPITLPVVSLDAGEISILPVTDGQSYDFQLRYVKKDGSRGPWGDIETHVVEGKTAPPENVTGFMVDQVKEVINFSWTQNPDLDLAGYEIRYGVIGCTWANGIPLTEIIRSTSFATPMLPPGTWDMLIKAVDTTGNYSLTENRKTFQVAQFYQILSDTALYPFLAGTLTNYFRNPNSGNLVPADQDLASGDDFDVFNNFVVNPFSSASYEAPEIDLGADIACRAWARIISSLGPGESGTVEPKLQIDYKLAGGSYAGFADWTVGNIIARYVKFKLVAAAADGLRLVKDFQPVLDKSF